MSSGCILPLEPLILEKPARLARRAWHEREVHARDLTDRKRGTSQHAINPCANNLDSTLSNWTEGRLVKIAQTEESRR